MNDQQGSEGEKGSMGKKSENQSRTTIDSLRCPPRPRPSSRLDECHGFLAAAHGEEGEEDGEVCDGVGEDVGRVADGDGPGVAESAGEVVVADGPERRGGGGGGRGGRSDEDESE